MVTPHTVGDKCGVVVVFFSLILRVSKSIQEQNIQTIQIYLN